MDKWERRDKLNERDKLFRFKDSDESNSRKKKAEKRNKRRKKKAFSH